MGEWHPIANPLGLEDVREEKRMGEYPVNGIYWSTYWSNDGEHETGENFDSEYDRNVKAIEMLDRGWTVAFGDFAGLQEKMIRAAKQYDESPAVTNDHVDEILRMLGSPELQKRDRHADINDPLWPEYWGWFERSAPESCRIAKFQAKGGALSLARQEDFNCWKDHRQDILDAWNAWKNNHRSGMERMPLNQRAVFASKLPERYQDFLQEMPDLLN